MNDSEFEMFCYEMFLKHKDEKLEWENKHVTINPEQYLNKNRDFLEKEYKRLRKKGKI